MFELKLILFAALAFVIIGVGLAAMILITRAKLISGEACKLLINDDEKLTKAVRAGSTLLNALLANGIPVPSPCGGKATCKQCKVQVLEGGGPILETDQGSFSKRDLDEGWRLSCQCKVKNDLKLKIPEAFLDVQEFEGKVLSNHNVASFIKELVVEIPKPLEYRSGAYLQFHTPPFQTNTSDWKETIDKKFQSEWEKFGLFDVNIYFKHIPETIRAYSMASYPEEKNILKFNIRIATPQFVKGKLTKKPWGICSSYTFSLKASDTVRLSGPYGESYMIEGDQELVFLIGGAGSSFGRSHIMSLFKTEKTKRKVTIWYGARSLRENIYHAEFEDIEREFENFKYHLVLSEPTEEDFQAGWPTKEADPVKTNFAFKAFELGQLKSMEEPEECLYYVCGPPLHNSSVMKLLDDYGVPRDHIVLDDFEN